MEITVHQSKIKNYKWLKVNPNKNLFINSILKNID